MEIIVDKRVELMAVVQTIDRFWDNLWLKLFNKKLYQCKYKENVSNYFGKYRNHETIKLWNESCQTVHNVSNFIRLPLCYSNPPKFHNKASIENNIRNLIELNFPYEKLVCGLKQFYNDTDFEHFFHVNKQEYDKILNDYANRNDVQKYVDIIDNYLGVNTNNYTVIISALLTDCYGFKIITNENITQNYSVICAYDYIDNKYVFGSEYSVQELLWHEISHLTINDITTCYFDRLKINIKEISKDLVRNYYTNVELIVIEYIVRAISIRLFEINREEKFVKNIIQDHIQNGFNEIESVKDYIVKNCEADKILLKNEKYIELMEYVISKIWE